MLGISVNWTLRRCCKVVVSSEFFSERVHRAHLRFADTLDVNINRQTHVAMPQNCLDRLVIDAECVQVGSEAATEGVPAVPLRERFIALKDVSLRLVL